MKAERRAVLLLLAVLDTAPWLRPALLEPRHNPVEQQPCCSKAGFWSRAHAVVSSPKTQPSASLLHNVETEK